MSQIKPDPNPKPNLEQPSDLRELEDGDWPAAIKPLHLKKIKAAVTLTLTLTLTPALALKYS